MGQEQFNRRLCIEILKLTLESRWKYQSPAATKYISTSESTYFPYFLALPIEVWVMIYRRLLVRDTPLDFSAFKLTPQMLCACRQIWSETEAGKMLYTENTFWLNIRIRAEVKLDDTIFLPPCLAPNLSYQNCIYVSRRGKQRNN